MRPAVQPRKAVDQYLVSRAPPEARALVNPRRGASRSAPLLGWPNHLVVQDVLFDAFGLGEYIGCVTAEMEMRPIPHVFEEARVRKLTELYAQRAPALMHYILARIEAPIQPLNKTSRLGWDHFSRPLSKRAVLMPYFRRLIEIGADEALRDAFIIMNVRLQPESVKKKRQMFFITDKGTTEEREITVEQRRVKTPEGEERIAARTRLVFNMPMANLLKQVLDTAIHNALLLHRVFHHNMYSPGGTLPVRGAHLCFDVKHFERHTASLVRHRGKELIGGLYGDITRCFEDLPFLAPSDTGRTFWFIKPNRKAGWSDQFASGDSAVAPAQKEVFFCLYQEFAERVLRIPAGASLEWVLNGGDDRLTIRNYGDDNSVSGDPGVLRELLSFMQEYLEAEQEEEEKFLGFVWSGSKWELTKKSYLLKTYLHERRPYSAFRPYPLLGWIRKRETYATYGEQAIVDEVFPRENHELLLRGKVPWSRVLRGARDESAILSARERVLMGREWLLGKDYLLSAEEKIASGLFEGLLPAETAPLLRALLPGRGRN